MSWLRSLAICCCLFLLLIPVRAAAAPSSQTFDCTGFGAIFYDNYVEYREVFLNDAALQIHICAPEAQSLTAKRLADALVKHLPQLDVDAGLPLTGSYERHLLLTNSSPADDDANVIYLGSLSADLDVIREGARFWANERTLAEPWMIEGYAMYLAERAEGHHLLAADACPDIALYAWQPESPEQAICGRIVAVSLFRDLATMVGAAQLHDVLHDLSAQSLPIAHWQLLTALEHITGQDLAPIFLRYHSFPPDEVMLLEQRDALRRRIERATAMAEHNGIKLPASVGEAFSSDAGAGAADLLDQLEPSLELIGAIEGNCGRLRLSCDRYWRPLPETTRDLEALLLRLRESHDFLGQYAVLHDNARALSIGIPTKLTQAAAALQPTDAVRQANVSLLYGHVLEERCADTGWSCDRAWRAVFERSGDPQKAIKFIADAQAALPELTQAASIVGAPSGTARRILAPILGPDAAMLLERARLAFAEGDLARARALVQEARAAQQADAERDDWLPWPIGGSLIGLVALLAGIIVGRKRRRARAQDAHDQLLANLLTQPPSKDGRKRDEKKAA